MRPTSFVVFLRLIGAGGVGAGVGAAVAGLLALVTGRVLVPGSPWIGALPVLAVFGAAMGVGVARLTRFWLLPRVASRRLLWGAVTGAVVVPLAMAFGQLGDLINVGLLLMLAGGFTTVVPWFRWLQAPRTAPGARARTADAPTPRAVLSRTR
ncbi:hypothetical protein NQK81_01210 [Amycolatopsis roodepoortensis]|uniref:hypothetical protein n=1 Tax=Amycolatopsis roodepoortensis TaxID=700274 RepID=UPI00214CD729|nr:hypothetical protein [Amycolatopsis roodepoortensis]UUV32093.1 hypothetical protein NQK81_01210 [Amycolatopsis roodepoortensis]